MPPTIPWSGPSWSWSMSSLLSRVVCGTLGRAYDLAAGRFPAVVRIETTNACNARCVICPHRSLKRPIQHIDDDLFRRVVDECAQQRCREVHLHNFGEPLLDKRLEGRVRYAKAQGIPKVKIFSNGSLFTRERARVATLAASKLSFSRVGMLAELAWIWSGRVVTLLSLI